MNQPDNDNHKIRAAQQLIDAHTGGVRGFTIKAECAACGAMILNRLRAGAPQITKADRFGLVLHVRWVCGARCADRLLDRIEAAEAEDAAKRSAKVEARSTARRARRAEETAAELAEQTRLRETLLAGERHAC